MCWYVCFFFFKQKTAYEMRISDWSSDVCSSDLEVAVIEDFLPAQLSEDEAKAAIAAIVAQLGASSLKDMGRVMAAVKERHGRSEEHTSELQSLMRISYAVFCLKKKR